jgi:vesicle-fusing ATPase
MQSQRSQGYVCNISESFLGHSPWCDHSFEVVACPSEQLAMTNTLITHPSDFQAGQNVFVKQQFALSVR